MLIDVSCETRHNQLKPCSRGIPTQVNSNSNFILNFWHLVAYTVNSFIFVGHLILCISWVGQSMDLSSNDMLIHFNNIAYTCNLKSTNSSVHEHVQCCQTTIFRAHTIKLFHSIMQFNVPYVI